MLPLSFQPRLLVRMEPPTPIKRELDGWLAAAAVDRGKVFRRVNKVGRTWGDGMTEKSVWHIVKEAAKIIGVAKVSPHDLRRMLWPSVNETPAVGIEASELFLDFEKCACVAHGALDFHTVTNDPRI